MSLRMKNGLPPLLIVPILLIYYSHGLLLQNDGDQNFNMLLNKVVTNYSNWINDSKLDPSLPTDASNIMSAMNLRTLLLCTSKNEFISDHTTAHKDVNISTHSNLLQETFSVALSLQKSYNLNGDFLCYGRILAAGHLELITDIPFNGTGKYEVSASQSTESLVFTNVKITHEHKLDLPSSTISATYDAVFQNARLTGGWNDTSITTRYIGEVQEMFANMINSFYKKPENAIKHPSIELLQEYLYLTLKNANLTEILPPEMLPSTTPKSCASRLNILNTLTIIAGLLLITLCTNVMNFHR